MRAHLFRPILEPTGDLLYGCQVTVRQADVSSGLAQTLYSAPSGTDALPNPFIANNGYVDIWLDTPARVNLLIQKPGHKDISLYLDAQPAAPDIVRALNAFTIENSGTAGQLLIANDDVSASWQDPPTPSGSVPVHNHDGSAADSVALGDSAVGSGTRSTAVGDGSQATADQASAFGYLALASAAQSVAVGSSASATAAGSIAIGQTAQAPGAASIAIGPGASAVGDNSAAIGNTAQALVASAVAIGASSLASGSASAAVGASARAQAPNSFALGTGAVVAPGHDGSVAVGPGALTTAAAQIMLGTATHTVVTTGLETTGAVKLAGSGKKIGFYGATPIVRPSVTGSRGGNAGLASLLTFLASLGLITDNTTA